jgi:tRNA(fMet)-specific endonuclease VapC
MDKALLDTDIFSEVLKGVDPTVATRKTAYLAAFGQYTVSLVTVAEVVKGFHKQGWEDRIARFLNGLSDVELLTLELRSAELAGRIYGDLERTGRPIGHADPLIAGIALHHDLVLITGNQDHYLRIQALGYGLKLDNWRV